jgi:hypothetical protein
MENANPAQQPQLTPIIEQDKHKRHRRSKNEQEGRSFACTYCSKSYLSNPALNSHLHTKHADILAENNIQKRKRGRPRKYNVEPTDGLEKEKFDNYFINVQFRSKQGEVPINRHQIANEVLASLFTNEKYSNKNIYYKEISSIDDNCILSYQSNKNINSDVSSCNSVMCKYLDFVYELTNKNYYKFVVMFVVLFRESINVSFKKKKDSENKEYCEVKNAENVPEQCNEFFSEFLEGNNFFDFDENYKNELIEIIQHFCHWLFINNYTKSKLSLA